MTAFVVLLLMGAALQDRPVPAVSGANNDIILPDEEYVIGPADVIEVSVLKMPELSREYRVSADGTIEMPFLGPIQAEKTTSRELAAAITKQLRAGYLVDPQVSVLVKHVNRRYFVQGAVRLPGVYNIEGRPTLLELLTIAGGLDPAHGSTAFIIHKTQPQEDNLRPSPSLEASPYRARAAPSSRRPLPEGEGVYEMKKANLNRLLRGEFSENVRIEPGDIVQIPPSDVFFVAGEVRAAGSFPLKEGMTLRQAISLAQNMNATAAPSKAVIFREAGSKEKEQIPVDITAVMRGRQPDVEIMANDIIVVPNSKAKSVYVPVLNSFGVNIAYGAARVLIP